ncbi:ribonuclease H-like domain-containing protein [Tanacetum coccineum]
MGYLAHAYYSISPTRYYKDDSCWSAYLKSKAIKDIISIGNFMEVLVLNHYVLVRKILLNSVSIIVNSASIIVSTGRRREYDIWSMRMRQYICHTDHNLWDIIVNEDLEDEATPSGEQSSPPVPKTGKQMDARRNQERIKSILLLAIPDEYLLKFKGVYEDELKRSSGSNSASQNLAFLSSENTNSTNEVSTASGDFGMDGDNLEELDLRWQVAMLTVRIECYKCHRKGHFARECRSERIQGRRPYGDRGYDWNNDFEVEPVNYALMAITSSSSSSSSDSEVQKCSKYLESFKCLQKNYDTEREKHNKAKLEISFKLLDESQVVLRAPRKDDVYILGFKEQTVPSGGTCPNWMFDLDFLINSMNYIPVSVENQVIVDHTQDSYVADKDIQDSKDVFDKEGQHQMPEDEQVWQDELEMMVTQELVSNAMNDESRQAFEEEKRRIASQKKAAQATHTTNLVLDSTSTVANAKESSLSILRQEYLLSIYSYPIADLPSESKMHD